MNATLSTPLTAQVVVHYRRDVPERYDVLISPVANGEVCVRLRSPVVGETICRLSRWPCDGSETIATRAIRAIVSCVFGSVHPAPRIVGCPDWVKVTLDLSVAGEQRRRRMLLLELSADAPTRGSFTRSTGSRVLRDESVRLCPEDADPVYAVTRLALATRSAAAEHDAPTAAPLRAPLRQPLPLAA